MVYHLGTATNQLSGGGQAGFWNMVSCQTATEQLYQLMTQLGPTSDQLFSKTQLQIKIDFSNRKKKNNKVNKMHSALSFSCVCVYVVYRLVMVKRICSSASPKWTVHCLSSYKVSRDHQSTEDKAHHKHK